MDGKVWPSIYSQHTCAYYLPEFGDRELSDISAEDVQTFLNQKRLDGKVVQNLQEPEVGMSSIFESAIKHGTTTPWPLATHHASHPLRTGS